MNYAEFKVLLESFRGGNKKIPIEDNILIPVVHKALKEVAQKTNPLLLITIDNENEILKVLEDDIYIKVPRKITDDNTIIEIDEDLILAVVHIVISNFSDKESFLKEKTQATQIINDYNWINFDSFNSYTDLIPLSLKAIDAQGLKKIYIKKYKTINGYVYDWDTLFINKLNDYLIGKKQLLTKSDINNINNFISFANKAMTTEHADYSIIEQFNNDLGRIGV